MALEDIVVGLELDPRDIRWDEVSQTFQIQLGEGMARNPAGTWSLDPAALAAAIAAAAPAAAPGLQPPEVQTMIDAALAARPASGDRVIAHGFDSANKTFTSTLQDGTQVVAGVPDIMTVAELAARTRPLLSVSGRPVANVLVLTQ